MSNELILFAHSKKVKKNEEKIVCKIHNFYF